MTGADMSRRTVVAAFLCAAIALGVFAGMLVTGLMSSRDVGVYPASSTASAEAASSSMSLRAEPSQTPGATHLAATPSAVGSAAPAESFNVAEGCFLEGAQETAEPKPSIEPIVAEDLRDRLFSLGVFSEPIAYVGSSYQDGLGLAFVRGFAACTGADTSAIRFGAVEGGATLGIIPMAAQVDGFTGPQLAEVMVRGFLTDEQRVEIRTDRHRGWVYRWLPTGIAVTASADTVYWFQQFCCVEVGEDTSDLPTLTEIFHDYLDRINDEPAL